MVEPVMNENEFELDGKVYVAVEWNGCDGCAFYGDHGLCFDAPLCTSTYRKDKRNVIFVEKQ